MLHTYFGKNGCLTAGWLLALKQVSLLKISFIVGSKALFFSGTSVIGPLLGSSVDAGVCTMAFLIRVLIRVLATGSWSWAICAWYVPGWVAAVSWSRPSVVTKILIPLSCMTLFIVHPVGGQAWVYTLYWFIPIMLYLMSRTSIFAQALSATCIAHAVGSVIHLYTINMTSGAWLLLMPIVPIERVLFACAMTVVYYGCVWCKEIVMVCLPRTVRSFLLVPTP